MRYCHSILDHRWIECNYLFFFHLNPRVTAVYLRKNAPIYVFVILRKLQRKTYPCFLYVCGMLPITLPNTNTLFISSFSIGSQAA